MSVSKQPAQPSSTSAAPSVEGAATGSQRDNFTAATKRILAQRVGWLCSNPACTQPTVGPEMGGPGTNNIGVAAHITAASEGFARYDARLTPEERKSAENGIWLCSNHAHMIDHDEKNFPMELLNTWKKDAEERAYQQLLGNGTARVERLGAELAESLQYLKVQLGLPSDDDLPMIQAKVSAAARTHLESFSREGPAHAVSLGLTTPGRNAPFSHVEMSRAIRACGIVSLVAEPGQGKSTTLNQLGIELLADGPTPLLVPLAEVGAGVDDLFLWITSRRAFSSIRTEHLKFLAEHGELAFLFDGWNEVSPVARVALIRTLRALRREFPLLVMCVATRAQAGTVPFTARSISITRLSDAQQDEIAQPHGERGHDLLDRLRRTPGVRDLGRVPFYLQALLKVTDLGVLPTTKEGTIALLVSQHDAIPERAEQLRQTLLGLHRRYLGDLAVAMMQAGTTTIDEMTARRSMRTTNAALVAEGLVQSPPELATILEVLVANHVLVHDEGGSYAFQHQQFQEWYAADRVEAAMRSLPDTADLTHPLCRDILDVRFWEEPVLFAVERLARATNGAPIIAQVIKLALGIDPMLAAEVIYLSSGAVWALVAADVEAFARHWHRDGQVDLAVGFMMATGRDAFADVVWPLVVHEREQVQSEALHMGGRIRPSVFGLNMNQDYAGLLERPRERLVTGLIYGGGMEGLEAAYTFALGDPSTLVKSEAVEALIFRAAPRQATAILKSADDEVWKRVASQDYFDGITDVGVLARLRTLQEQSLVASADSNLGRVVKIAGSSGATAELERVLRGDQLDFRTGHVATALHQAFGRFPEVVAEALKARILAGQSIPWRVEEYLAGLSVSDESALARVVTDAPEVDDRSGGAAYLIGPGSIARLIAPYVALRREVHAKGRPTQAEYGPIGLARDKIARTRPTAFAEAIVQFAATEDHNDIEVLADLITVHGKGSENRLIELTGDARTLLDQTLEGWAKCLLHSGEASRKDFAEVVDAMRRVPAPTQAPWIAALLAENLKRREGLKALVFAPHRNQEALNDYQSSYFWNYRDALVAIGTDEAYAIAKSLLRHPDFGHDAAIVMRLIAQPVLERSTFRSWPDLERAQAARERRYHNPDRSLDAAEVILDLASEFAGRSPPELGSATAFAAIAVVMPHRKRGELLNVLGKADVRGQVKLDLFNSMVVGGIVPPSAQVLEELLKALSEIKSGWLDQRSTENIISWLKLLPLTENPYSLLDGINMLPAGHQVSQWRIRDLLAQFRLLDPETKHGLLRNLAIKFPDLLSEHQWFEAVTSLGFRRAVDLLLEGTEGLLGRGFDLGGAHFMLPEQLAGAMEEGDEQYLVKRLDDVISDAARGFLHGVILKAGSVDGFILATGSILGRRIIRSHGELGIRDMLYRKEPTQPNGMAYELIPRDASLLRKRLFGLTTSNDTEQAAIAVDFLVKIDEMRHDDGVQESEPRHPDIVSGRVWPFVS